MNPQDRDAERGSDPGERGDKPISKVKAAGCRGKARRDVAALELKVTEAMADSATLVQH